MLAGRYTRTHLARKRVADRVGIHNRGGMMADRTDWNRKTIEEFRSKGGKVGGIWEGRPLLLLTTSGARSGQHHTTPTMYLRDGDRLLVAVAVLCGLEIVSRLNPIK